MVVVAKKTDNGEVELVYKNINDIVIPPKWWLYAPKETIIISSEYENWIEIELQFNYSLYVLP